MSPYVSPLEHEPTPTSHGSARVRGEALAHGAKAIEMKVQDEFYIFVMSAVRKINPKKIRSYFKSQGKKAKKLRFASAEELFSLTGLVPGSVPPFGRPILDLPLYTDPSIFELSHISFNAGSLSKSISMNPKDYQRIAQPLVFDFTELAD